VNAGEAGTVTEVNLMPFATGVLEMKRTLRLIQSSFGLATLFLASSSAHAFCTEFDILGIGVNCVDEGHKRVTGYIKPILRDDIWGAVWNGNYAQDNPLGDFRNDGQRHFESCRFVPEPPKPGSIDYIRSTYQNAIGYLNPADPNPVVAADRFGKLLHTVQDFYSHTNWINLLNLTGSAQVSSAHLFERTLGEWPLLDWLGPVRDGIILGQVPPNGLPAGWSVEQAQDSETPVFMTSEGEFRRGIITGWNEDGACPDVRPGTTVDQYSHIQMNPDTGQINLIPRTKRLVHGTSEVAGIYGGPLNMAYQADRPCHDDNPTSVCIQKDTPGRTDYGPALHLAEYQTAHEWCRLLHLAKDSQYGYSASSILMALWAKPEDEPFGPHPISTACGTPPDVLAGKPGPIEVTVDPQAVAVLAPSGPDVPYLQRHLVFTLYTGDFRRSTYRAASAQQNVSSVAVAPMTMCVKPGDKLVATVWGWDDRPDVLQPVDLDFNDQDKVLRGTTLVLNGPGFQAAQSDPDLDLDVNFLVTVEGDDSDGDGLSTPCGEVFYGTDPNDADTDNDGLNDGTEVNTTGTDPLDPDNDDDGLPDGQDVDWIEDFIAGIPDAAIKSPAAGNRNAMLNLINDAEALLLKGNRRAALDKLKTLRMRVDGCGVVSDGNDWIVDCAIQTELRTLLDLLIANVSA
jgi:hypothetical protein